MLWFQLDASDCRARIPELPDMGACARHMRESQEMPCDRVTLLSRMAATGLVSVKAGVNAAECDP